MNNDRRTTFSAKPILVGDKVILRPFLLDQDVAALRALLQDPEVARLTGSLHGPDDPEPTASAISASPSRTSARTVGWAQRRCG